MKRLWLVLLCAAPLLAWGLRGHREMSRAAVRALPADGPAFVKTYEDYIVSLAIVPDSWRTTAEPFAKIFEDPNHGWFQEQSLALMQKPPRSRYEFLIELHKEHLRTKDPRTNVRWTGTLPYAAMETYERVKAGMRRYRMAQKNGDDTKFIEMEVATHIGFLGHYIEDSANPMHDSIHHDGWVGENSKGYTREPQVHGRFESAFVDKIQLTSADIQPRVAAAKVLADPFLGILEHIQRCYLLLEPVYQFDKDGVFTPRQPEVDDKAARAVVYQLSANAAGTLRDLIYTAWVKSAEPPVFDRSNNPISLENPKYNPATGSAPAQ